MFELLHRLQQRPEKERKQIAFWSAFGITFLIFIVWVISFFAQITSKNRSLQNVSSSTSNTVSEHAVDTEASSVGQLQDSFKGIFSQFNLNSATNSSAGQ